MWQTLKDIFDRATKAQRWFILLIIPILFIIFVAYYNFDSIAEIWSSNNKAKCEVRVLHAIDSTENAWRKRLVDTVAYKNEEGWIRARKIKEKYEHKLDSLRGN